MSKAEDRSSGTSKEYCLPASRWLVTGLLWHYKSNDFQLYLRLIKIGFDDFLLGMDHGLSLAWVVIAK